MNELPHAIRFLNAFFLKAGFTNCNGLLDGKTGLAVFFFHLAEKTNNVVFEEFAGDLIDQVIQNISPNTPMDFSTGLLGMSWGLQYLINNGFIESDGDIFVEWDNEIFQFDKKVPKLMKNYNDFDGHLLYYLSRAKDDIWNEKILNLLWTDLRQQLIQNKVNEVHSPDYILSQIWFLIEIRKKTFCPDDIDDVIKLTKKYISDKINDQWDIVSCEYLSFFLKQLDVESVYYPINSETVESEIELSCKKTLYDVIFGFTENIYLGCNHVVDNEIAWKIITSKNPDGYKFVKYAWMGWNDTYNIQPLVKNDTVFIFSNKGRSAEYGIGTYLNELSSYLKETCQKFIIIHLGDDDRLEFTVEKSDNILYWYFPEARIYTDNYYKTIVSFLKLFIDSSSSHHVFHLNYTHNQFPELIKKAFICKLLLIIHYFDWAFSLNGNLSKMRRLLEQHYEIKDSLEVDILRKFREEQRMMVYVDHVVGLANYMKNILLDWYRIPEEKISIINNGLTYVKSDTSRRILHKKYQIDPRCKILLFAGRIDNIKGVLYLIRAFRDVLETNPYTHLWIVGGGWCNHLFKEAVGIWNKLTFTGKVNKEQLRELYQLADIGIIPSLFEPFGYVAIEMMMHGLPVIATATGGLDEIIVEGETGFKIPILENGDGVEPNIKLMATQIIKLLNSDAERERLGKNGITRFLQLYTTEIMGDKYRNILNCLMN